jgi:lysozyme
MNREKIKQQLIVDEGYRAAVYRDTFGNLTVGIGHLVLPSDQLTYGETVLNERIMDLFEHDLLHAEIGCRALVADFDKLPEDVQCVLVNMCFNLGAAGLKRFHNFLIAISDRDYPRAADEMKNSIWYNQVGPRARRLYKIIKETINEGGAV